MLHAVASDAACRSFRAARWEQAATRFERRRAFTLIELAIVLLILGILAAAGAPRYIDALANRRVVAAAQRLAADLKYARRYAQMASIPLTVVFDAANDSYQIDRMPGVVHRDASHVVQLGDPLSGVDLVSADFATFQQVAFDIYGRPDHTGSVTLASGRFQARVQVLAGGASEVQ